MSDYPFDDFSPREIAVSLVPKPSVDEADLWVNAGQEQSPVLNPGTETVSGAGEEGSKPVSYDPVQMRQSKILLLKLMRLYQQKLGSMKEHYLSKGHTLEEWQRFQPELERYYRSLATSTNPKQIEFRNKCLAELDESLPSDTGTGVSAGDTVGMMIPARTMGRRMAGRHTRGLMIDPPTGDSLAGDGTRGMMPREPQHVECSFPMPEEQPEEEPEEEIPMRPGRAELSPETKNRRVSVGMNPALRQPVRMQHRLESEKEQIKIGAEIEKEHFKGSKPKDKTPKAVATTHVKENPPGVNYYPSTKKPKGCGEKLTWTCKVPAPPKE